MTADIRNQVVQEIKSAAFDLFSIQLDKSTDMASCSQLMVFIKYVHLNTFNCRWLLRKKSYVNKYNSANGSKYIPLR